MLRDALELCSWAQEEVFDASSEEEAYRMLERHLAQIAPLALLAMTTAGRRKSESTPDSAGDLSAKIAVAAREASDRGRLPNGAPADDLGEARASFDFGLRHGLGTYATALEEDDESMFAETTATLFESLVAAVVALTLLRTSLTSP
jgi:hypothetical protein